ncbi:DOMON domain-containing protein [Azotosporobacter soli]|uniref:DOMON domain-containing protein n=1 Tax=Azotosporobacter soli TaxID=3055040 RepID=UPI0031FE969D
MERKRRWLFLWLSILCLAALAAGCANQKAEVPPPASTPVMLGEWKADGVIDEKEYGKPQMIGDVEVFSRVKGDTVLMALRAKTKGYLAIGIGAAEKMDGADILMFSFKDGKILVEEKYSTSLVGLPKPKQGEPTVSQLKGNYTDGVMTVEFARKLDPGGAQNKALVLGDNKLIWAIGESNVTTQKHTQRGAGVLKLQAIE